MKTNQLYAYARIVVGVSKYTKDRVDILEKNNFTVF